PRTERRPTAPVPFGDVIDNHISDDGEAAADVEIPRAIHYRRVNLAVRAGKAAHADPVSIAEGRVNAHGIHRLCIIHHYDQVGMRSTASLISPRNNGDAVE